MLAVAVLLTYLRFLRMADELTRLIQVQGMVVGFGMWFFLAVGWQTLEAAGAAPLGFEASIVVPVFSMVFG